MIAAFAAFTDLSRRSTKTYDVVLDSGDALFDEKTSNADAIESVVVIKIGWLAAVQAVIGICNAVVADRIDDVDGVPRVIRFYKYTV